MQGVEVRKRLAEFSKTIKRPKVVARSDFSTFDNDRMLTMERVDILKEQERIKMLFR
jgi:hypothetical protein